MIASGSRFDPTRRRLLGAGFGLFGLWVTDHVAGDSKLLARRSAQGVGRGAVGGGTEAHAEARALGGVDALPESAAPDAADAATPDASPPDAAPDAAATPVPET